jgi:NTP pyrophosphatase (non-canonical NTP hydrolase)
MKHSINDEFFVLALRNKLRCENPAGFNHKIDDWTPGDWALAVAGETGEMCNFVKKLKRIEDGLGVDKITKEECIANIGEELADIVIYADLLATRLGLILGTEIYKKFNKTSDKMGCPIKL